MMIPLFRTLINKSYKPIQNSIVMRLYSKQPELSKRKQFMQLKFNPNTLALLDNLGLGIVKNVKYLKRSRKRRYEEDVEALPSLQFFAGAKTDISMPKESLPEICVAGRSNVGKSRLLNALFGSSIGGSIVRFADRPGVTKQLNFFSMGDKFHVVDMPGYGFAYAKEEVKETWEKVIENYLKNRKTLKCVYLLIDSRHGFKTTDREFMNLLESSKIKYHIVLTKCDLVNREILARRYDLMLKELKESFLNANTHIVPVSSMKFNGIPTLRKNILHNVGYKPKLKPREDKTEEIKKGNLKTKDKNQSKNNKQSDTIKSKKEDKIEKKDKVKSTKYKSQIDIDLLKTNIYN